MTFGEQSTTEIKLMHCKTVLLGVALCVVTDWRAVNWMKEELS